MPAERRKKTKTLEEIPQVGDPERKRVLNVLAQRRYRQRQREKMAALSAQAKRQSPPQPLGQGGGLQLPEVLPELVSTSSSSEPSPEDSIEEIVRSSEDYGFSEMDFGQDALDMSLFGNLDLGNIPGPTQATSARPSSSSSASPNSFNFPLSSDVQLQVPILAALRAFSTIATALNVLNVMWDPNYLHVLPPTQAPNLPWNLQPTPAQMNIPHHPLIDSLPWPSVREKLICLLSLPSMWRPPVARDDDDPCGIGQANAIQRLAHDVDDLHEGIRVYGNVVGWDNSSELVEDAWEMGERFYRNWWFCVDPKAIQTTNRRRQERGLAAMKLKG
ncbi:hypothetical protein CC80DRAFT_491754 [Byssothecium circinans]|uniref:BZIP domain-containing protein n=1 Tax=Byssothecium circinans TaxID=147558 RepID=A0A6A5TX30_9PLEO|nr:hypothetical protein CC80DRAFT_491754 [Byssothecium circinans]